MTPFAPSTGRPVWRNYTVGTLLAPGEHVHTRLALIPRILALILLAGLYLARWTLVGPLAIATVERAGEQALGAGARVSARGISGSLVGDIRIERIELSRAATESPLRELTIRDLTMRYRISELLPWISVLVSPVLPDTRYDWLLDSDGRVDPAGITARAHSGFPEHLELSAAGSFRLARDGREVRSRFTAEVGTGAPSLVVLHLEELAYSTEEREELSDQRFALALSTAPGELTIDLTQPDAGTRLLTARAEASSASAGSYRMETLSSTMSLPGIRAEASVTEQRATGRIEIRDGEFTSEMLAIAAPGLEASPGQIAVEAQVNRETADESRTLADILLESDGDLKESVRAEALVELRGVEANALTVESLSGELSWDTDSLTLSTLRARARVPGIAASNEEPSPAISLRAERLSWTPETSDFAAQTARVEFGGGVVRLSGAGTLADGNQEWTESEGQIEGVLQVRDPERTLALFTSPTGSTQDPEDSTVRFTEDASARVAFSVTGGEQGPTVEWDADLAGLVAAGLPEAEMQASGSLRLGGVRVGSLTATLADSSGRLTARGELRRSSLSATVEAQQLSAAAIAGVAGWDATGISGTIGGVLTVDGPRDAPDARMTLQGETLEIDSIPASFAVDLRQDSEGVALQTLAIDLGELFSLNGAGRVPITVGLSGVSFGQLDEAELELSGGVHVGRTLSALPSAVWGESRAEFRLRARGTSGELTAEVNGIRSGDEQVIAGIEPIESLTVRATFTGDDLQQTTFDGSVGGESIELVSFSGSARVPGSGGPRNEPLQLTADLAVPMARVSHLIPGVTFLGGNLSGRVEQGGRASQTTGRLRIRRGIVKFSAGVPAISSLTGRLNLDGNTITVRRLTGEMGSGQLRADGTVRLPDGESGDRGPELSLQVRGDTLLVFRTPDLVVRADIEGSIDSQESTTLVEGRVDVDELTYNRPVELLSLGTDAAQPTRELQLFSVDQPWARSVSLDVRVLADRTIFVDNNLYDGVLSADLTLHGSAAVPRAQGTVFGTDGEVSLPTATLSMDTIQVRFPANASFRPSIEGQATTSIQGYDMSISIDGQFPNVEVSVASSPALPTDEALILLSTGRELSQLSFEDGSGTVEAVGTVLGRSFLNQVSGSLSDEAEQFFDRFEFSVERDSQEGTIGDIDVQYQLSEERRWFLEFERAEEDEYTVELSWRLWTD